MDIDNVGSV